MKNNKTLKIVLISLAIIFFIPLVFLAGFWIYKVKDGYMNTTNDYYGGYGMGYGGPGMYEDSAYIEPDVMMKEESYSYEYSDETRSIIRTGSINIAVDDIDESLDEITAVRAEFNASVINLNDYGKGKDRGVGLTIKVEESKFEELYNRLKDLDGEFLSSSISESDVTDTVVDLEARLSNYKSVETQFVTLLGNSTTVEETLAIYKELNEVRYNIERVEAELKNIGNQTKYSYIYMHISQSSVGADLVEDEWRPEGVLRDAIRALVGFAKFVGSGIIWLIVFIPVIALIVVPVILIQKKRKK
jgi:VIT1/CCC1 family predicted Fe2+/Mn2+ transporter